MIHGIFQNDTSSLVRCDLCVTAVRIKIDVGDFRINSTTSFGFVKYVSTISVERHHVEYPCNRYHIQINGSPYVSPVSIVVRSLYSRSIASSHALLWVASFNDEIQRLWLARCEHWLCFCSKIAFSNMSKMFFESWSPRQEGSSSIALMACSCSYLHEPKSAINACFLTA